MEEAADKEDIKMLETTVWGTGGEPIVVRIGRVLESVTSGHFSNKQYSLLSSVFIRKLRGQPPEPVVTARPCVGLCYLKRLNGELEETTTRKPVRPCIGLCFLEKIGKVKKPKPTEPEKEGDKEEIVTSEYDEK